MNLIQDLEIYRLENKITQEQLAKELGVAFATVNRWLNGRYKPRKIQQYHIEKLLNKDGISSSTLLTRKRSNNV
jgi:transcriptional regulator with XRE-family HTH domain